MPKTRLQPVSAPPLAWQAGWRPLAGHAMAAPLRAAQGAGVRGGLGPRAARAAGLLLRSALAGAVHKRPRLGAHTELLPSCPFATETRPPPARTRRHARLGGYAA
ncbi:hypothetical protein LOD44_01395 [Xylella fastidiosa subsp. multiplex]|uniref:hypothetical protein n=2 Tax=Xylella fastidiosa TaxID=2371 RepID=UPI0015C3A6EA|nr:hypothetical protein [Xylella fastidiosa]KAJ4853280.1 hypothetical protein XYFPCFBP8418_003235 [Xylella fastidiosa subsp. multiplex]MDC6410345.1 hypothetical protein [Xylella fastidiosa subsp. multiplex]MDC6418649.1 hypothetical protein [Xylella fastidiosa subsp. multiplex]MDD0860362.1 hypothetical protein [Xylella fastidiosa subsp. multiplex]MDD0866911.1 hypothetical protein [Xylella fastidiosa subsp. multiplex]